MMKFEILHIEISILKTASSPSPSNTIVKKKKRTKKNEIGQ